MKYRFWLVFGLLLLTAVVGLALQARGTLPTPAAPPSDLEVLGRTQCVPGKRAIIAPVPLHPVVEVLVAPGDRVKKEQKLVRLDDDEPQADVRGKKAQLDASSAILKEARRTRDALEHALEVVPEQRIYEARLAALKAEHDEKAARAAVESAEAELEHYTLTAPIDGVVVSLEVYLGMVSRPGTTVWGEIFDLSEIDVRCELPPDQVDRLAAGQKAEVRLPGRKEAVGTGKVVFLGLVADRGTGLVPVVVRLSNPEGRLRCGVPAQVRFVEAKAP